MKVVEVEYFSDILCAWAYGAQRRLDQLSEDYGGRIRIRNRFIPIFGDAHTRIETTWKGRGGFAAFHDSVDVLVRRWSGQAVHAEVWNACRPRSSGLAHLYMKASELGDAAAGNADPLTPALMSALRSAFFHNGLDIACRGVIESVLAGAGIDKARLLPFIDSGAASAALSRDAELAQCYHVPGSPTLVLNEGRQLLYGDVAYHVIEGNVRDVLAEPVDGAPAWC